MYGIYMRRRIKKRAKKYKAKKDKIRHGKVRKCTYGVVESV